VRSLDFSSWHALWPTLFGLVLVTLLGVGIRLVAMQAVQQRHQRENRQINERLRTLMAAYKTLGGSFTGDLAVDPTHLRHLRQRGEPAEGAAGSSDRSRRIRDAVEAALSDILLLGTDEQVRWPPAPPTNWPQGGRCTPRNWWFLCGTSCARRWTCRRSRLASRSRGRDRPGLRRARGAAKAPARTVQAKAVAEASAAWRPAVPALHWAITQVTTRPTRNRVPEARAAVPRQTGQFTSCAAPLVFLSARTASC